MNDPHVVALHYRADAGEGVEYRAGESVTVSAPDFTGTLEAGRFVAKMSTHYPTQDEARIPVDAYVRAWEISIGVLRGRKELSFTFERAEIIDRAPPPGSLRMSGHATVTVTGYAPTLTVTRNYPPPPEHFTATPLVESLWLRYERYTQNQEPLLGMAYYCLTRLERDAGSRRAVARKFGIAHSVLDTIASTELGARG